MFELYGWDKCKDLCDHDPLVKVTRSEMLMVDEGIAQDKARIRFLEDRLRIIEGLCRRHTRSPKTSPFNPVKTIQKIEAAAWKGLGQTDSKSGDQNENETAI